MDAGAPVSGLEPSRWRTRRHALYLARWPCTSNIEDLVHICQGQSPICPGSRRLWQLRQVCLHRMLGCRKAFSKLKFD